MRDKFPKILRVFFAFTLAGMWLAGAAGALEIRGGNINTTAPGTSFDGNTFAQPLPWDNVGSLNGAGVIYLGDIGDNGKFWVLAPDHVAPSLPASVNFAGTNYNTVAGSYAQLTSPDNSAADMVMFQINVSSDPAGLVPLTLESTTPALGTSIYYVGNGGGTKNWGFNTVAGYDATTDGYGSIYVFYSHYGSSLADDPNFSDPNEAQAIVGDSGGAAFIYDATTAQWELGGMMVAVDQIPNPTLTGDMDIATYRDDILSIAIPEPGAEWLLACGGAVALAAARKRRV